MFVVMPSTNSLFREKYMSVEKSIRGVTKITSLPVNLKGLSHDLALCSEVEWNALSYGSEWTSLLLFQDSQEHEVYKNCTHIHDLIGLFNADVFNVTLAALGPGGKIKEHRDISGGTPVGVARFHFPIVTDKDVDFFVSKRKLNLAAGEIWNLDTTYLHSLHNKSKIKRVHLIIDFKMNDNIRSLLPKKELRDYLHDVNFAFCCIKKGLSLVLRPKLLWERCKKLWELVFLKKSSL